MFMNLIQLTFVFFLTWGLLFAFHGGRVSPLVCCTPAAGRGPVRFRFKLFGRERGESHSHEDAELPYCCPVLDLLIPGNWKNVVMKLWQAGLQTMGVGGLLLHKVAPVPAGGQEAAAMPASQLSPL